MLSSEDVDRFIEESEDSGKKIFSIVAQTGTGKSTTFPIEFSKKRKTIMIVQPTVAAALSLAIGVKKWVPSSTVGTATEGEVNYQNSELYSRDIKTTPIVYCTSGHFKNILLKMAHNNIGKKFVDYIMLDEAHTGNLDYDLIMYLFKYLLDKDQPLPKLILASATPAKIPFDKNDIFEVKYSGSSFPVSIEYHNTNYDSNQNSQRKLYEDLSNIIRKYHLENEVPEDKTDSWLVFCPGKEEILKVIKNIENLPKTIVIPAYSSLGEDQMRFLDEPPIGFRKIVVSTNIAESSITIPGLTMVFDSLYEKLLVTGGNGGTMLVSEYVSKSSAEQRKGRAGRTNAGKCYRMCTRDKFDSLQSYRIREIERIPPDRMIIDLIGRNLKVEEIIFDNSIPEKTIKDVKKRLISIGLLTDEGNEVSDAGRFIQNLSLSPRMGMFYWLWQNNTDLPISIGALIACVIDSYGQGYMFIPRDIDNKNSYISTYFMKYKSKSGLRACLKIFLNILKEFKTFKIEPGLLVNYCVENSLNNQRIKDALRNTRSLLEKVEGKIEIGSFDVDKAVDMAIPYLYQAYNDIVFEKNSVKHIVKKDTVIYIPLVYRNVIPLIQMEAKDGKNMVSLFESFDEI